VLDNLSPQIHGMTPDETEIRAGLSPNVRFIQGDVRNQTDWEQALDGQDAVVHLAADTGTGQSMYQIERYVEVNVRGTAILLDYLVKGRHSIQKVVVASSRAIYGEGKNNCPIHGVVYPNSRKDTNMAQGDFQVKCPICGTDVTPLPTDEESHINPASIYAITKLNQEQMVLCTCHGLAIPAVALRYQNVYGPGQSLKNPYTGILSIFSTAILNEERINVFEDGLESRDFVFIEDVAEATVRALESEAANDQVINVGSGTPVTVMHVAQTLKKAYCRSVDIVVTGNYRIGDIRHNFASIKRMEKMLGFRPVWSFDRGVEAFVEWVRTQKVNASDYAYSLAQMRQIGLIK
jgi:dTDP-L-rhamnose 4-epimerase